MVFVTVGNAQQGFLRLLNAVDQGARDGVFGKDAVLIQSGHNAGFVSERCHVHSFIPMDEFQRLIEESRLVITHGGCTVMSIVRLGKVPVVMPRRKKYGEHVNDHQLQLTAELERESWIVPAYEPAGLPAAVNRAMELNLSAKAPPKSPILQLVCEAIEAYIPKKFA